uniref:Uncharacterized protein n=1 Tax=Aegilops tauschii subsp. strangulata TaxID=200361 RepID=A0A453AGD7_AEGTS
MAQHRRLPRRHRARALPARALRQEGRRQVHRQRPRLLRARARQQRRRRRVHPVRVHQGVQDRVDAHVQELGGQLAVQRTAQRPEPLVPGHQHRRPDAHLPQRRARRLGLRPDLRHQQAVLLRDDHKYEWFINLYSSLFLWGMYVFDQ